MTFGSLVYVLEGRRGVVWDFFWRDRKCEKNVCFREEVGRTRKFILSRGAGGVHLRSFPL